MIKFQTVELLITLTSDSGKRMDYRLVLDALGGSAEFTNEDTGKSFLEIYLGKVEEREVEEAEPMTIFGGL